MYMLPGMTRKILGGMVLIALLSLWISGIASAADNRNSFEKISDDFGAGKINHPEMLLEKMKAVFAPDDLASEFKSATPAIIKSGTDLVMEVLDNWDDFTAEQQSLLTGYMSGPIMPFQFDSPGGFFKIHYNTDAPEPVPPEDLDGNSVPDYVERIAEYCDSSYRAYTAMGYLMPPTDSTSGGDEKYDIYLVSLNAYGVTIPDGAGDSVWNDYKSYIWIHYSFLVPWLPENDDPDGDTIGAQKVSCAHEFHHAVQLAYVYNYSEYVWWMEPTSTWMEEVVYPEVNDNYMYLNSFFSKPYLHLYDNSDLYHKYGAFVWAAFLQQKFDYTIIRRIWEASRFNSSLDAVDSGLAFFGTDLLNILPEFAIWNYYTGDRAVPGMYYADAADYPQVHIDQSFTTLVHDSIQAIDAPDGLGCNYMQFVVDTSARGILEIILEGNSMVRWANAGIYSDIDPGDIHVEISTGMDPVRIYKPFIEDYPEVTAVPMVVSRFLTGNNYYLSNIILPYGDANYDRQTNVGDATYLINYVFFNGPAPKPIMESGDANCDGGVNVADAVTIINYVFKDGDAPCSGRNP